MGPGKRWRLYYGTPAATAHAKQRATQTQDRRAPSGSQHRGDGRLGAQSNAVRHLDFDRAGAAGTSPEPRARVELRGAVAFDCRDAMTQLQCTLQMGTLLLVASSLRRFVALVSSPERQTSHWHRASFRRRHDPRGPLFTPLVHRPPPTAHRPVEPPPRRTRAAAQCRPTNPSHGRSPDAPEPVRSHSQPKPPAEPPPTAAAAAGLSRRCLRSCLPAAAARPHSLRRRPVRLRSPRSLLPSLERTTRPPRQLRGAGPRERATGRETDGMGEFRYAAPLPAGSALWCSTRAKAQPSWTVPSYLRGTLRKSRGRETDAAARPGTSDATAPCSCVVSWSADDTARRAMLVHGCSVA